MERRWCRKKKLRFSCKNPAQNYRRLRKNRRRKVKDKASAAISSFRGRMDFQEEAMKQADGTVSKATLRWSNRTNQISGTFFFSSFPKVRTFLLEGQVPDQSISLRTCSWSTTAEKGEEFSAYCMYPVSLPRDAGGGAKALFFMGLLRVKPPTSQQNNSTPEATNKRKKN